MRFPVSQSKSAFLEFIRGIRRVRDAVPVSVKAMAAGKLPRKMKAELSKYQEQQNCWSLCSYSICDVTHTMS